MEQTWQVAEADLENPAHQRAVLALTSVYAEDGMGQGGPLSDDVRERLVEALRAHPTTRIFLAWIGDEPVGLATCFVGFSTFAARPLLNVHDLAVRPDYRGRGLGSALLAAAEAAARASGYVRLTLEVKEHNPRARAVYAKAGFVTEDPTDGLGATLFMTKTLG